LLAPHIKHFLLGLAVVEIASERPLPSGEQDSIRTTAPLVDNAAAMANSFSYQKLPPQQVRLLTPRRSSNHKELRFALRAYSVDDPPSYVAVSYTWGTSAASNFVYLNDVKHWVRPNLWWCLYYVSMNPSWRHVWVDYLCIDQTNIEERNQHVQTMDRIFSNANLVVAWLGVEDDVGALPSYLPMKCLIYDSPECQSRTTQWASRVYWNRRWIVQELLLAVDVNILCGGHCMSWPLFKAWVMDEVETSEDHSMATSGAVSLLAHKVEGVVHYPEYALHDLLLEYRHTGCSDPRDRVFALLGLLSEDE